MNIECDKETLDELANAFRYNDAVIRNLILNVKHAVKEASPLLKEKDSRGESGHFDGDFHHKNKGGRGKPFVAEEVAAIATETTTEDRASK